MALGVGFQLIDDVLDLAGSQDQLGKPRGNDLDNGNYTLPVIYALEERSRIRLLLQEAAPAEDVVDQILKTEAIARASADARAWISQAKDALRDLSYAQGLIMVADTELGRLST